MNSAPAYRISNGTLRFQTKFVTLITAVGLLVLFFTYHEYSGNMSYVSDTEYRSIAYNSTYPLSKPKTVFNGVEFRIGIVADLDKKSKVGEYKWISYLLKGTLLWNAQQNTVTVRWDGKPITLYSSYGLAGRGMELSELVIFNGRLLTFDDRTGIVYEVKDDTVIPWVILTDGNGRTEKGMFGHTVSPLLAVAFRVKDFLYFFCRI